jgi:hypothetical protein
MLAERHAFLMTSKHKKPRSGDMVTSGYCNFTCHPSGARLSSINMSPLRGFFGVQCLSQTDRYRAGIFGKIAYCRAVSFNFSAGFTAFFELQVTGDYPDHFFNLRICLKDLQQQVFTAFGMNITY